MAAASAASGFRTWLQNHNIDWLTPRRLRALTIAAMAAAGLFSTITVSGSSAPTASAHASTTAVHRAACSR